MGVQQIDVYFLSSLKLSEWQFVGHAGGKLHFCEKKCVWNYCHVRQVCKKRPFWTLSIKLSVVDDRYK